VSGVHIADYSLRLIVNRTDTEPAETATPIVKSVTANCIQQAEASVQVVGHVNVFNRVVDTMGVFSRWSGIMILHGLEWSSFLAKAWRTNALDNCSRSIAASSTSSSRAIFCIDILNVSDKPSEANILVDLYYSVDQPDQTNCIFYRKN
jgi:hypothetical protein